MKKVFPILCIVALTGCSSLLPAKTQIVNVPIQVKCNPTLQITEIEESNWTDTDKTSTLHDKFAKSLSELEALRGQNKELKAALNECVK